jgi:hypothetical protein
VGDGFKAYSVIWTQKTHHGPFWRCRNGALRKPFMGLIPT